MRKSPALFALGFRPFYLLGAAFAIVGVSVWIASYTGRLAFSGYLTGMLWHSHEMVFGFVPAVMAGFLFTAVRNWTGLPTPTGGTLAAIALLWLLARIMLLTGPVSAAVVLDVLFLPVVTVSMPVAECVRSELSWKFQRCDNWLTTAA